MRNPNWPIGMMLMLLAATPVHAQVIECTATVTGAEMH